MRPGITPRILGRRPHGPGAALVVAVGLVLAAGAAAAEGPATVPLAGKFTVAASFAVPDQTQLLNFVAEKDAIFASVRYAGALVPNPMVRSVPPVMMNERKSCLARWDAQGNLIWRTEIVGAYNLARAGNVLALAYDPGTPNSERGIYWIDPESGKVLGHEKLTGRPAHMQYYPEADIIALIIYPPARMAAIKDSWMEVQAFKAGGTLQWTWKTRMSELQPLRMDSRVLAVIGSHPTGDEAEFAAQLDPRTGKELWSFPLKGALEQRSDAKAGTKPPAMESCVGLPCGREGLLFLDTRTGRPAHWTPLPNLDPTGRLRGPMTYTNIPGTVYLLTDHLEGITAAAVDYASGQILWQDETGTVSYIRPTAWGDRVVFLSRRLSKGLLGRIASTELRIRSAAGAVLAVDVREAPEPQWNDVVPPQAVGDRLYVGDGPRLVALDEHDGVTQ